MPVHDWKLVPAGIFHDFHHEWLSAIKKALNAVLPADYYALAEQSTTGSGRFGPDVLALSSVGRNGREGGIATAPRTKPKTTIVMKSDEEYYRRKKKNITIRHVSGDRVVAVIEVISPGNKTSPSNLESFVKKVAALLDQDIHLLIVDPFPPTPRDPNGIHAAVWEWLVGDEHKTIPGKPLTAVAYEQAEYLTAYLETFAVGDELPEMPVFLEPDLFVDLSLETTYCEAFAATPKRWRDELVPKK